MSLISVRELKKLFHVHYILNILLALSYLVLKITQPFCSYLFETCEFEGRESEIMFFVIVIIAFRTRKQGAVNLLPYLNTSCMLFKLGNIVLWFNADPIYGVIFIVLCLLHIIILPEPAYQGPESVLYLNGADLEEELKSNKRNVWLIELYAAWNPTCSQFAPTFAELSSKYSLDNLKFGKVDLSRSPEAAEKYKINTAPFSKQLPTLILFKNGREELRRPLVNNSKLIAFAFHYENIVATFDLNNIYETCKSLLKSKTSNAIENSHPKEE